MPSRMNVPLPPFARARPMVERLHDRYDVSDPYRWLEDGDAPETRAWVESQNAYARELLDGLPGRKRIAAKLDELLTTGAVSTPTVRGVWHFYQRRDGRQDQPVLVVRQGLDGTEKVLLDPAGLSERGVVALDWWYPSEDGSLVAYGLSEGGTELSTLRVLRTATGEDLSGLEIPHTRACSLAWLPDGSGFYYTRYPEPGSVPSGDENYHRRVYFHALANGEWRGDAEVFGSGRSREDWPNVDLSPDGRWLLVIVSQGWARSEVYLLDREASVPTWIPVHEGTEAWADGEIAGDRLFLRTNEGAPNYRVVAVDPANPTKEGWREIIPERPDRVLNSLRLVAGRLVVEELQNATSRLSLYDTDGQLQQEAPLPGPGSLTGIGGHWSSERVYVGFTSFAEPPSAYHLKPDDDALTLFARGALPPGLRPRDYEVEQVWYPSRDGTPVSMFLVHRPGLVLDGNNPTVLTGYGGFNVSRTPLWVAALPLWLDSGGVYALPNLRGGGEYGEAWHQAGMLDRKQNVFDDFIAAAEWLMDRGYTSPERLAITGGSNGGLLVGAALTRRPELFRAVVCQVPLLDMLRYHHLRIARLWIPEYGDPDDADAAGWLLAYSPYHQVRDGVKYPAVFFLTAEGDSRVDPMHGRKMAARLQAATSASPARHPIVLRVEEAAGHGVGKPRNKVLAEATDIWSFLAWQLEVDV